MEISLAAIRVVGYKAKILTPNKSGIGITGIYFDSLWGEGMEISKFQLSGFNLNSKNEQELIKAFQSLRFRRPSK